MEARTRSIGPDGHPTIPFVGVDFEPMNVLAARFWTSAFALAVITMSRIIDPRVQVEGAERTDR